ncbi:MAG: hypothetical protein IPK16_19985 [Anaerolineales bacterium]|nr:hypothetical protein [Anaerolineales bacterium]
MILADDDRWVGRVEGAPGSLGARYDARRHLDEQQHRAGIDGIDSPLCARCVDQRVAQVAKGTATIRRRLMQHRPGRRQQQ